MARNKDRHLPKGARCSALDENDLTVTGDAASPDFRFAQGPVFVTVGSTAAVYRTLREANTSWSRGSTSQTTTCLGDIVRLSAAPVVILPGELPGESLPPVVTFTGPYVPAPIASEP